MSSGPSASGEAMTDPQVPLSGQSHRQPDGRRVKNRRQEIRQADEGVAPVVGYTAIVSPGRVEVDETRQRTDARQRVRHGHCDEYRVRWTAHVLACQYEADEKVGDDGDENKSRREEAVDEDGIVGLQKGVVWIPDAEVCSGSFVERSIADVQLSLVNGIHVERTPFTVDQGNNLLPPSDCSSES